MTQTTVPSRSAETLKLDEILLNAWANQYGYWKLSLSMLAPANGEPSPASAALIGVVAGPNSSAGSSVRLGFGLVVLGLALALSIGTDLALEIGTAAGSGGAA